MQVIVQSRALSRWHFGFQIPRKYVDDLGVDLKSTRACDVTANVLNDLTVAMCCWVGWLDEKY